MEISPNSPDPFIKFVNEMEIAMELPENDINQEQSPSISKLPVDQNTKEKLPPRIPLRQFYQHSGQSTLAGSALAHGSALSSAGAANYSINPFTADTGGSSILQPNGQSTLAGSASPVHGSAISSAGAATYSTNPFRTDTGGPSILQPNGQSTLAGSASPVHGSAISSAGAATYSTNPFRTDTGRSSILQPSILQPNGQNPFMTTLSGSAIINYSANPPAASRNYLTGLSTAAVGGSSILQPNLGWNPFSNIANVSADYSLSTAPQLSMGQNPFLQSGFPSSFSTGVSGYPFPTSSVPAATYYASPYVVPGPSSSSLGLQSNWVNSRGSKGQKRRKFWNKKVKTTFINERKFHNYASFVGQMMEVAQKAEPYYERRGGNRGRGYLNRTGTRNSEKPNGQRTTGGREMGNMSENESGKEN